MQALLGVGKSASFRKTTKVCSWRKFMALMQIVHEQASNKRIGYMKQDRAVLQLHYSLFH